MPNLIKHINPGPLDQSKIPPSGVRVNPPAADRRQMSWGDGILECRRSAFGGLEQ